MGVELKGKVNADQMRREQKGGERDGEERERRQNGEGRGRKVRQTARRTGGAEKRVV